MRRLILLVIAAIAVGASAQQGAVTLFDSGGFENEAIYPAGPLQSFEHGEAEWLPASQPAEVVNAGPPWNHVLRRSQRGSDQIDTLRFPSVSSGILTVAMDVQVSTLHERTLDICLLHANSSSMASFIGWGTEPGSFAYYDAPQAEWIALLPDAGEWRRYEVINYLSGERAGTFDVKVDGDTIAENLPFRHAFSPGTSVGRVRFGAIRGPEGVYGQVDNLGITHESADSGPDELVLTNSSLSMQGFTFSFHSRAGRTHVVEWKDSLTDPQWTILEEITGDGTIRTVTDSNASAPHRFYRVRLRFPEADGYRGIWFTLGQFSEYGDKYSGGLGTYTANHIPLAVYSPEVDKTFFVYGGTRGAEERHLLIMASYYDHASHLVPRPTVVHDKNGVNDPHDNPSMSIDAGGHIWIFISGRASARPGFKYRSSRPYDVSHFELVAEEEFTYPQPWFVPGKGFFHLFTKYTDGRELYWETSPDGFNWSADHKLAGIEGHYQVSNFHPPTAKIGTFFNRHPGHNVDRRTDLYYVETRDFGETWTTADGTEVPVPLATAANPARVINYSTQEKLMYTIDLQFDENGHPVLLYITSSGFEAGPQNGPREWTLTRWTGLEWVTSVVTASDHNYDLGSLFLGENEWTIIGPTEPGPQPHGTGGEVAIWSSLDRGATWTKKRDVTVNSEFNHAFVRRPLNAKDPFRFFWADGNPDKFSASRLYFGNSDGTAYWQLPYEMNTDLAHPVQISGTD